MSAIIGEICRLRNTRYFRPGGASIRILQYNFEFRHELTIVRGHRLHLLVMAFALCFFKGFLVLSHSDFFTNNRIADQVDIIFKITIFLHQESDFWVKLLFNMTVFKILDFFCPKKRKNNYYRVKK